MHNLLDLGFILINQSEFHTEYKRNEFRIFIYDYPYKDFNGIEKQRQTFVVHTKKYTSGAYPIKYLDKWLKEHIK